MSELNITQQPLPDPSELYNRGKQELQNLRELKVGSGSSIFFTDKEGSRWGHTQFDNAPAWIKVDGTFKFKDSNGNVIVDTSGLGVAAASNLINIQGWSFSGTFSALDADTVSWTAGTITLADGTTFSIDSGDTGNITAITYIYFDKGTSLTVLQTTTTSGTSIGANKILLAVAKNETGKDATFQAFGGKGVGVLITADNIAANTITANEIAANTITASQIATDIISAGKIVAGLLTASNIVTGTLNASVVTVSNINADNINAGTIAGRTLKANGGAGVDVWVENDGVIRFRYGGGTKAFLQSSTSGHLQIKADNEIWMEFNDDGGGNNLYFVEDGGSAMLIDSSKNVYISSGDLDINGTLSKNSGSFKIDHPLKPETHYLYHSFVESPDMLNIYKGRAKTIGGKCIIKLPDYFEALNKDIEYQLTAIKSFARLTINKEIKENKFEVTSDEDCEFSWTVMGVRKDVYAEAHPIIVEVEKELPGYLHPELYGIEDLNLYDKHIKNNCSKDMKGKIMYKKKVRKKFIK